MEFVTRMVLMIVVNILLLPGIVSASVVIHQVLYDPIGTESGGEAIQLKNMGASPVNISGFVIRTQTSATDAIIADHIILQPESTYLLADVGWSEHKDNPFWPSADDEQAITMRNTDSGVALFNGTQQVDAVGWGIPTDSLLFEGTAHPPISAAGMGLIRHADTDDNSQDFIEGELSFSSNRPGNSQVVHIEVHVPDTSLTLLSVDLADNDPQREDIQVLPFPGKNTSVPISVNVKSALPVEVESFFMGSSLLLKEQEAGNFQGQLIIPSILLPGYYDLTFTAQNSAETLTWTETIEVLSVIGFEVSNTNLNVSPRADLTITNIGNVALDLGIKGMDLVSDDAAFMGALRVFYDAVDQPGLIHVLSPLLEILDMDILPLQSKTITIESDSLGDTKPGIYQGSIELVGVAN